jgi:hypothetical protein
MGNGITKATRMNRESTTRNDKGKATSPYVKVEEIKDWSAADLAPVQPVPAADPIAKEPGVQPVKTKDAIIFLPGIGDGSPLAAFEAMARRIAAAFDKQAITGECTFEVREMRQERQKSGLTEVATLVRKDGHKEAVIADLFLMDYTTFHERERANRSAASHILHSVGLGISVSLRILQFLIFGRSLRAWHKIQLALACMVALAAAGFCFLILATAFHHLLQTASYIGKVGVSLVDWGVNWMLASGATNGFTWPKMPPVPNTSGQLFKTIPIDFHILGRLSEGLIVILAAASLLIKSDIKRAITSLSQKLSFSARYIQTGLDQGPLVGQLSALLESIVEKGNKGAPYRNVHLFAQGFGSLLAIDALFPRSLPEQRYRAVTGLVTIGCPFDLVRAIWPQYYTGRQSWGENPATWLNVFHPEDILASDFSDKSGHDRSPTGIQLATLKTRIPRNLHLGAETFSTLHRLALVGFRLQNRYWNGHHDFDRNCWDVVVRELYKDDAVLS